jgi:hypothetical protein
VLGLSPVDKTAFASSGANIYDDDFVTLHWRMQTVRYERKILTRRRTLRLAGAQISARREIEFAFASGNMEWRDSDFRLNAARSRGRKSRLR